MPARKPLTDRHLEWRSQDSNLHPQVHDVPLLAGADVYHTCWQNSVSTPLVLEGWAKAIFMLWPPF